jgi:transposase-like protein
MEKWKVNTKNYDWLDTPFGDSAGDLYCPVCKDYLAKEDTYLKRPLFGFRKRPHCKKCHTSL